MPDDDQALELSVRTAEAVADDIIAIELVNPSGDALPRWDPGAHVDLVLRPDLIRQYSLCGDPEDRGSWRLAVLNDPNGRGGSALVHAVVSTGSSVSIRGPRNHFPLVRSPSYLFIAGGIGITPILPMVKAVAAAGHDWHLVYGGRCRSSMAFGDELEAFGDHVVLWPQDELGLIDLETELRRAGDGTLVYCCGPDALLTAVETVCERRGLLDALHVERFAPRVPPTGVADGSFVAVLKRSGLSVTVPADTSILNACREAGVSVESSCEEGTCCTCETAVLEGVPDHRDSALSRAERDAGDVILICVSRSLSDTLVLDL